MRFELALAVNLSSLKLGLPFLLLLIGLFGVGVLIWAAVNYFLRRSLPQHSGTIEVTGIGGPVTISRDEYGVPTIEAADLLDVLFGQGFTHAQDRLWQMELNRRVGAGRLAEILGEQALPADIFLRRLELKRAAQNDLKALTEEERAHLEAYCAGVNAGIQSLESLPAEFGLLRINLESWRPIDTLAWVQVMSMDLCSNWEQELLRARLLEEIGAEGAELLHLFPKKAAQTVPPNSLGEEALEGLWQLYEEAREYLPNGGLPGGSNAWVAAGWRTETGNPLLANDPHLIGRVPSIWYESRLICQEMDVQGACFPGVPFVVIGANSKVAWGITNSYADTQDLFIEKLDGAVYQTEDGPQPLETFEERIAVRDQAPYVEKIQRTRHGPLLFKDQDVGLALRWKNYDESHPLRSLKQMNSATSASEFKEALRDWQAPSSNFVYADIEGNIGYLMAGQVPIRKKGTGLVPSPGWSGEYDWIGTIPFEELPQVDNPKCGYLVTANNPVVDRSFPHHISWDWMNPVRAQRIEELLLSREKLDLDFFREMQMDVHCQTGLRFARVCEKMEFEDQYARKAQAFLAAWDGNGEPESGEMALYQMTMLSTLVNFLTHILGEQLCFQFLGQSSNPVSVMAGHTGRYTLWLIQLLEDPEHQEKLAGVWPDAPSLESIIETVLSEGYQLLRKLYGPQPELWQWGFLHRLQFKHPLGVNRALDKLFNGPTVGAGGDTDTVFQTAVSPHAPYAAESWCPSFRLIVELAPEIDYHSVLPTGQSGHPSSRNYMDQFLLWSEGQTRKPGQDRRVLKLTPR
ncbi:MAG: penicillin acylase family protein [Vulcanimicrobiota bacterium]